MSHSCKAIGVYWRRLLNPGSRWLEDAFYKVFISFFSFLSGDCRVGYEKSSGVSLLLDLGENFFFKFKKMSWEKGLNVVGFAGPVTEGVCATWRIAGPSTASSINA